MTNHEACGAVVPAGALGAAGVLALLPPLAGAEEPLVAVGVLPPAAGCGSGVTTRLAFTDPLMDAF